MLEPGDLVFSDGGWLATHKDGYWTDALDSSGASIPIDLPRNVACIFIGYVYRDSEVVLLAKGMYILATKRDVWPVEQAEGDI